MVFLFLFFSHLTYNSLEDHGGYNFKIYPEAGHFSLSLPVTTLLWATTVFSLACFNSLPARLLATALRNLQTVFNTTPRVILLKGSWNSPAQNPAGLLNSLRVKANFLKCPENSYTAWFSALAQPRLNLTLPLTLWAPNTLTSLLYHAALLLCSRCLEPSSPHHRIHFMNSLNPFQSFSEFYPY